MIAGSAFAYCEPYQSRHQRIRSADDVTAVRNRIRTAVYGSTSLPSEVGTLSSVTSPVTITGATCQKMTMTGYASRPRVWTPNSGANGKLFIMHQGHSGTYGSYNMTQAIQQVINAGYTVCGLVMPGGVDEVTSGTSSAHNTNQAALSEYLGPVSVAINTLIGTYPTIYMTGLSGGGWTSLWSGALDTRIARAYPTGGHLDQQMGSPNWDWEQGMPGARFATYMDAMILGGAGSGRHMRQISYTADDCCFRQWQYDMAGGYDEEVEACLAAAGFSGQWDHVWYDNPTHTFNSTVISTYVLGDIP